MNVGVTSRILWELHNMKTLGEALFYLDHFVVHGRESSWLYTEEAVGSVVPILWR